MDELKQEITSAALGAVEDVFEARPDGAFAFGVAGAVDVGRIGQQQQHAALAVVGERVQIEQLVIGGRRIDLEIAGMDDHAQRRRDGERDAAHDRMRDVDEFDSKRTELRCLSPGLTVFSDASLSISCSSRRRSTSASVNAVP